MSRHPVSLLTTTALAVGALFMAAGPALAQRGGHGGFHGGGFHGGGFHGGGFRDGFRGGFFRDGFRGFRGGFREFRGFRDFREFRGGFRDGFFRDGFRRGFFPGFYGGFPGFYGYGRGFYSYGYGPSYAYRSSGYVPTYTGGAAPVVSGYYSPPEVAGPSAVGPAGYGAAVADNSAHIRMEVPADAEVWFAGVRTSQTGPVRDFVSPPLGPATRCVYEVRARWKENGRPVEQTREVTVRANAWVNVDFTRPAPGTGMLPVPEAR